MKRIFSALLFLLFSLVLNAQVEMLNKLGQTPGGAGFHVNWDSSGQKLIVGCGASIWVYDFSNPADPQIIAKRPFMGLINETSVYGNTLFAAVTHDGVYALDYTSPDLDIIHRYNMKDMGDSAAYDLWRSNDTLFVSDQYNVRMLKYNASSGFTKLASFGGPASYCVTKRGPYIAVGNKATLLTQGNVSVYHIQNLNTPVATWSSTWLNVIQKLRFADLKDDIIYVCAGPQDLLFTKSNFLALNFDGATINPLDTFSVQGGVLGIAQMNIINFDSRNDTLYICTTAAYDANSFPLAYMPIVDATGLPADTMKKIGYVIPGLWHFDAAVMDGTPYLAMSSEWCGFLVSDVSELSPYDTLGLFETGGWCVNAKVRDNILWACHEGWGLVAYEIDSLLYTSGFHADAIRMHIYDLDNHFFCFDLEFLNDTLLMVNSSEVYNIKPWQMGGQQQLAYDMNKNWMNFMSNIQTNVGQRMIATYDNLLGSKWIQLFDPFDISGNFPVLAQDSMNSNARGMCVAGDTVYYGKKYGNDYYLVAQKAVNDEFVFLDSIKLTMVWGALSASEIYGISVENGIIAVAYNTQFALFRWNGNILEEAFVDFKFNQHALDIELRNGLVYVADRFYGMKVYDVSSLTQAELVAEAQGTGGWTNVFGSDAITVGEDGQIYLCDFHAGVIIIEAYDTISAGISEQQADTSGQKIYAFPNPAQDYFIVKASDEMNLTGATLKIMNAIGEKVQELSISSGSEIMVNTRNMKPGMYFISISRNSTILAAGKIMIR